MVKSSKGIRRRTRGLKKSVREKGMVPITRFLQRFEIGERACIVIDPSVHDAQPHPKFQGRTGEITGTCGKAYILKIKDGKKSKSIIAGAVHLRRVK